MAENLVRECVHEMASYQPQHPPVGRRADAQDDVDSLDSSWIITELARATNENIFSDTVSSVPSDDGHSVVLESDYSEVQVVSTLAMADSTAECSSDIKDSVSHT